MKMESLRKILGIKPNLPNMELDQVTWDAQHQTGKWSYLDQLSELAHYSVIVGYCQYFNPHARILDVGCGHGVLQQRLNILPYQHYTGIDISPSAIDKARQYSNHNTEFLATDASCFSSQNNYDIIIFNESLYCFNDCLKILDHYQQLLAPEGTFIVSMHVQPVSLAHWEKIDRHYQVQDSVKLSNHDNTSWICKALRLKDKCINRLVIFLGIHTVASAQFFLEELANYQCLVV
jgi:2-polyprenyl-3-methyl-5-hydroxy-6-metoxy-1,4-benzoquinol methylase